MVEAHVAVVVVVMIIYLLNTVSKELFILWQASLQMDQLSLKLYKSSPHEWCYDAWHIESVPY
jgi:hypothetical protein